MNKISLMPRPGAISIDVLDVQQVEGASHEELKDAYRKWEWHHEHGARTKRDECWSRMEIILSEWRRRK